MNDNNKTTEIISTMLDNGIDFNQLTSREIGTLRAISDNRITNNDVSDRVYESIENLQAMGFVDNILKLTSSGMQAINLANLLGGSRERRRAATLDDVLVDIDDIYNDDYTTNGNSEKYNEMLRSNQFA